MPIAHLTPDLEMHYLIDDFTDAWRKAETILLLHGNAESSAVWFGWVPHLARHYRVVRADMRGYGASSVMPRDFPWSLDRIVDDYVQLLQMLNVDRFHLVGAKLGGTVARRFAARYPERVSTLTVAGTPPPQREGIAATHPALVKEYEAEGGVAHWANRTMAGRLGSRFAPEGAQWWINLMGQTAASTMTGVSTHVSPTDISADLPRITCPTLVITTEGSALGSVEATRAWQQMIPNSRLLVLPGNSYHVAASDADRCAQETLAFISHTHAAFA